MNIEYKVMEAPKEKPKGIELPLVDGNTVYNPFLEQPEMYKPMPDIVMMSPPRTNSWEKKDHKQPDAYREKYSLGKSLWNLFTGGK